MSFVWSRLRIEAFHQCPLAQIPTIRGMRQLNVLGLCITVAFVGVVTAGCLYDGGLCSVTI